MIFSKNGPILWSKSFINDKNLSQLNETHPVNTLISQVLLQEKANETQFLFQDQWIMKWRFENKTGAASTKSYLIVMY